jgi:glycosyltransferase involved in cell wall biosynthesis
LGDSVHLLHLIPDITGGGGGRNLLSVANWLHDQGMRQSVIATGAIAPSARAAFEKLDVAWLSDPSRAAVRDAIATADVVILHYWHSARMEHLLRQQLPESRIMLWAYIFGGVAPQILSSALLRFVDGAFVTATATTALPAFRSARYRPVFVPGVIDCEAGIQHRVRDEGGAVRIGYLGYVDFIKLHPDFVAMSAAIDRDVLIPVWGAGNAYSAIEAQARELGRPDRFQLNGPTDDVLTAFHAMDVFGYPLTAESYGTADRAMQEAMYCELPSVVFDRPGLRDLIVDGKTGYVVREPAEYVQAVTRLVDDPDLRVAMGRAAKAFLLERFDRQAVMSRMIAELRDLASTPKRWRQWPGSDEISGRGAALFVDALADHSGPFRISLRQQASSARDDADEAIVGTTPGMRNAGAGGLFDYRQVFPEDPQLLYWSGLALLGSHDYRAALSELVSARRFGFPPERLLPWIMKALASIRSSGESSKQLPAIANWI